MASALAIAWFRQLRSRRPRCRLCLKQERRPWGLGVRVGSLIGFFWDVALEVVIAIVAVGSLGTWYYALWRGWRYASRDQTPAERANRGVRDRGSNALPVALAVVGALDGAAIMAIAVGLAVVVPVLLIIGDRNHRRRERRIRERRERRHGTSDGED